VISAGGIRKAVREIIFEFTIRIFPVFWRKWATVAFPQVFDTTQKWDGYDRENAP
jgi:hypothetical protein